MEVFVFLAVIFALVLAAVFLRRRFLSFRGQRPDDYTGLGPDLDLRRHLDGESLCDGWIFGPTGRMTSRFQAVMAGHWSGNDGMIEVEFVYDGGTTQSRSWHLTLLDGGRVIAEAEDTIGRGSGQVTGPTLQLLYTMVLPEDAGGQSLQVTDWMYLSESGTIMNRIQFRKGGILAAELVATIRKKAPDEAESQPPAPVNLS
ncbi:DUF3833 family protein [Palleronia sp.]|uniref:DUF3833 family protein n=1 Tax=Palleronia sp. TaxID=1940284 RepID=UPI0035C7F969